uniref:DUF19 domain-containing protein n=1 Tax=Panagrellus redivivus TaxID=6233 RepID=A0A7E4ZQZ3_PANRE
MLITVLLLIFWVLCIFAHVTDGSSICLRSCTSALRNSIVSIIGSSAESETELLAPFHSIIAKSRTNAVASRKVNWICFAVTTFDTCANKCPSTNAKAMRMATVYQWNTICNASKEAPKAFAEFVNCERKHIDKTSRLCQKVTISDNMALGEFCEKLQSYSQCYASVPFECSHQASEVWLRVNNAIQKSYNTILQLSSQHLRLPPECQNTMATTVPAGIGTTLMPPITTKPPPTRPPRPTTISPIPIPTTQAPFYDWRATLSTLVPPVGDDSSGMDDYSYFQQTDDYKYFGKQKTTENDASNGLESTSATTPSLDYWIDLDGAENQESGRTGAGHSQRNVDVEHDDGMGNEILDSDYLDTTVTPIVVWPSTANPNEDSPETIPPDLLTNAAIRYCVLLPGIFAQMLFVF